MEQRLQPHTVGVGECRVRRSGHEGRAGVGGDPQGKGSGFRPWHHWALGLEGPCRRECCRRDATLLQRRDEAPAVVGPRRGGSLRPTPLTVFYVHTSEDPCSVWPP